MSGGLFVPSGARVPLVGLPPIDRPLRLPDGRAVRYENTFRAPSGPNGEVGEYHRWLGPAGLSVVLSLDATVWGPLLHASIAYADLKRRPTWEDITALKAAIFGDVDACMVLPKYEDYVNVRDNCFHLTQTPERWGLR